MINILIADDHKLMADGICSMLEGHPDIRVAATAFDGREALEKIKILDIDVALLDIDMPVMNGIDCTKQILKDHPEFRIGILTMHQEKALIRNLLELGVKAYLLKTASKDELVYAIKIIYNGGEYFNSDITRALMNNDEVEKKANVSDLTNREVEVIKLISDGNTNAEIGHKLNISPKTADVHRTNIMKKLDIHNTAALVRFAFKNGIIE